MCMAGIYSFFSSESLASELQTRTGQSFSCDQRLLTPCLAQETAVGKSGANEILLGPQEVIEATSDVIPAAAGSSDSLQFKRIYPPLFLAF